MSPVSAVKPSIYHIQAGLSALIKVPSRCAPITDPGPAEGGWLFTWGGVFTWTEHQRDKKGAVTAQPDSNRGCLGLGDTLGRDLPTRQARPALMINTYTTPRPESASTEAFFQKMRLPPQSLHMSKQQHSLPMAPCNNVTELY